jgi:hypothetical protein
MTNIRASVVLPMAALSIIVMLGGCAETKQVSMATPGPGSSFLPDPSLLQKGASGEVDQVYLNPNANWGSYTKMILDPVTIWAGRGSNMDKASPKEQKALADAFYTDLYNAASKRCKMVTEPAPGTMRWKIALVDASSANPFMNTLCS